MTLDHMYNTCANDRCLCVSDTCILPVFASEFKARRGTGNFPFCSIIIHAAPNTDSKPEIMGETDGQPVDS